MEQVVSEQLAGRRKLEVFNGLSLIPKWNQPGTSGDTGGPSNLPHGTYSWIPGNPGSLNIRPVRRSIGKPWDNYYFYNTIQTETTGAVYFSYEMSVMFPTQKDIDACTAWENEIEVCEAGLAYNMAWQCLLHTAKPAWRLFDLINQKWVQIVSIPSPAPKPGQFMQVLSKFRMDRSAKTVEHLTLAVNGTEYPVESVHGAKLKWSAGTNYTHNAFQLDSDGKGTSYTVQLADVTARRL